MQVRTMKTKFDKEIESNGSDVQRFMAQLQAKDCFVRFKVDDENQITCVFWGTPDQKDNLQKYGSVIVQDNTFNTNK